MAEQQERPGTWTRANELIHGPRRGRHVIACQQQTLFNATASSEQQQLCTSTANFTKQKVNIYTEQTQKYSKTSMVQFTEYWYTPQNIAFKQKTIRD